MLIVGPNGALPDPSLKFFSFNSNNNETKRSAAFKSLSRNESIYSLEFGYIAKFNWTLIMIIKKRRTDKFDRTHFHCLGWNGGTENSYIWQRSFDFIKTEKDLNDRIESYYFEYPKLFAEKL